MEVGGDGAYRAAELDQVALIGQHLQTGPELETEVVVLGEGVCRVHARHMAAAAHAGVRARIFRVAVDQLVTEVVLQRPVHDPVPAAGYEIPWVLCINRQAPSSLLSRGLAQPCLERPGGIQEGLTVPCRRLDVRVFVKLVEAGDDDQVGPGVEIERGRLH